MAEEDAPVIPHQPQESEEHEEEALSLCDMPLNDMSSVEVRRSSFSEASELFEFSNDDVVFDMCPADEIFSRGKLEPFKHRLHRPADSPSVDHKPRREPNVPPTQRLSSDQIPRVQFHVSRSNSVGTCGNSPRPVMMRNSRSLDYRKLRRSSSSVVFMTPEVLRNSSKRATSKPHWCSVVLGTVKPPMEMELSDMKNRQARRNSSTKMFPAVIEGGGKIAENRSSSKFSWRILRALTCKDRRSVSVTTSLVVTQAT